MERNIFSARARENRPGLLNCSSRLQSLVLSTRIPLPAPSRTILTILIHCSRAEYYCPLRIANLISSRACACARPPILIRNLVVGRSQLIKTKRQLAPLRKRWGRGAGKETPTSSRPSPRRPSVLLLLLWARPWFVFLAGFTDVRTHVDA